MSGIFDQIINYSPPLIVSGTVNYKGTWNASTNNPTLNSSPAASTKGDYYVVSTAGTQFGITFAIGDWIISNGTAWEKVDLTDAVSSVFGRTGAVVGVSTDYSAVGLTNTAIGAANPSTGAFTTVTASSTIAATGAVTGSNLSGTNTGDQTTITGNAGSATVLQTPRAIYGNNFDGSAALTQVIASTYGGTGNGFAKFSGPASSEKTFTLPNASSTLLYDGGALGTPSSGTVTNLTGTASININGTVGATTPSTGAFTTLATSGNMGIGTGAPSASSGYTTLQIDNATNGGVINLAKAGTVAAQIYSVGIDATISTIQSGSTLTINPHTANIFQIAGSEKGRFTSTGLGIGTTNPTGSLEIAKIASGALGANLFLRNNAATAAGNAVQISMSANSGGDATSPTAKIVMTEAANAYSKLGFFTYDADGVVERLTISSAGNVGIGVTPSAWNSDYKVIQLGFGASIYGRVGNNETSIVQNWYRDTSGNFKYLGNGYATSYSQLTGGGQAWYNAPNNTSGAGAALTLTQAMTLDASGFLQLATTTSSGKILTIGSASASISLAGTNGGIYFGDAGSPTGSGGFGVNCAIARSGGTSFHISGSVAGDFCIAAEASKSILFGTSASGNSLERARIDSSGNLLVGTTTASASPATGVQLCNTSGTLGGVFIGHDTGTATGNYYATFNYASGLIGSITQSGTSAVLYNVTSDYRRKSNVKDLTGSGTFIDALKPRTFDWDTGDKGVGFIAHEFAEVSPSSVSGEKDAVDADGKPVYQAMQASSAEVIANLVAELKSLRQRVAALENS